MSLTGELSKIPTTDTPSPFEVISYPKYFSATAIATFSDVFIFWILIWLNSSGLTPLGKITSLGYKLISVSNPDTFIEDTPTSTMIRQRLLAEAETNVAITFSESDKILGPDVYDSFFEFRKNVENKSDVLGRDMSDGIDLQSIIGEVSKHYIYMAISKSNGNKAEAAKLVGLSNYQTLSNWIKKYESA